MLYAYTEELEISTDEIRKKLLKCPFLEKTDVIMAGEITFRIKNNYKEFLKEQLRKRDLEE